MPASASDEGAGDITRAGPEQNVNVREIIKMPFLPCILCGRKLDKRIDKNGKPYFVCDDCGIQLFVRRKRGMELLEEAFRNLSKAQLPFTVHARSLHEIRALIKEIDGVKAEIDKIGWFFASDEELRVRNALKAKLQNLFFQLEQMAKENKNTSISKS